MPWSRCGRANLLVGSEERGEQPREPIPSTTQWWIFVTIAVRPPGSPWSRWVSHSGRSCSEARRSDIGDLDREVGIPEPGGRVRSDRCRLRSKSASSTHQGPVQPEGHRHQPLAAQVGARGASARRSAPGGRRARRAPRRPRAGRRARSSSGRPTQERTRRRAAAGRASWGVVQDPEAHRARGRSAGGADPGPALVGDDDLEAARVRPTLTGVATPVTNPSRAARWWVALRSIPTATRPGPATSWHRSSRGSRRARRSRHREAARTAGCCPDRHPGDQPLGRELDILDLHPLDEGFRPRRRPLRQGCRTGSRGSKRPGCRCSRLGCHA